MADPASATPRPDADDDLFDVDEAADAATATQALVVEDDPDLRGMYAQMLTHAGFSVATAEDGRQGYEKARELVPEIVLSDMMMPGTDGWGLLALLREDLHIREARFIFLSCYPDYLSKLQKFQAGADDYLEKGLALELIRQRIVSSLEARWTQLNLITAQTAPFSGRVASVGIQHLLNRLCNAGVRAALTLADGWGNYRVLFHDGVIASASGAV